MTDTEATAPKKEMTPEQKAQRQTVNVVARAMARLAGKADTTGDTKAEGKGKAGQAAMKALWAADKKKYTTNARKLVKDLAKNGVTISHDPSSAKPKAKGGRKAKAEA